MDENSDRECGTSHVGGGDWRNCTSPACVEQRRRDEEAGIDLWANKPVTEAVLIHYQTGSSTVRCGATMRHWRNNPTGWDLGTTGWDLGTITVDPAAVTCPECVQAIMQQQADAEALGWHVLHQDAGGER